MGGQRGNQWGRGSLLAVWAAASRGLCRSPGTSQRRLCSPDLELLQDQLREDNSLGRCRNERAQERLGTVSTPPSSQVTVVLSSPRRREPKLDSGAHDDTNLSFKLR